VVGVVDAAEAVEHDLRVRRQDGIRPKRPDLADELLAQREIVLERAVGLVEEGDALVADDRRGGRLLGLPQGGQLERIEVRILPAGVSARSADEPADRARVDPRGGGRGRPEVGVVGVRDDHHEPVRAPVVGGWFGQREVGRRRAKTCLRGRLPRL